MIAEPAKKNNPNHINIINGPSKQELKEALFEGKNPLQFVTDSREKLQVYVLKIGQEDGSLRSWLIEGTMINEAQERKSFSGWFHTTKGRGTFRI